jgi:hypothetical protein
MLTRETKPFKKVLSYQSGEDLLNKEINGQITKDKSQKADQQIQGETNVDQRRPDQRRTKE